MARRPLRDLDGSPLGGLRDLTPGPRTKKSGKPAARKQDLIERKLSRYRWFQEHPGVEDHHLFCICDDCDRLRNPEWWTRRDAAPE